MPKNEQDLLDLMRKEFGKDTVTLLSEEDEGVVTHWLDMNVLALNYIISGDLFKGFPMGRTVEYYGDPSTGKTLIALYTAADAIRKGFLVIYKDPECALDRAFAEKIGADPNKIIYDDEIDTVEQLERDIEKLITIKEAGKLDTPVLIILDSLAMLSTEHEMETPDKSDMTKAKKMKQITRRLTRKMSKNDIGFLPLNHTIANISPMPFAPKKTTTGGAAIPFLASVRLENAIFCKIKDKKSNEVTGITIRVRCVKNKLTRPFRECEIDFDFRTISINKYSGLDKMLAKRGIIEKCKVGASNGYKYNGETFKVVDFPEIVEKNKNWLEEFNAKLKDYDTSDNETEVINVDDDIEDQETLESLEKSIDDLDVDLEESKPKKKK